MNKLSQDSFVKISQHELNSGENLDVKLKQAAHMGFFYVEMPEECKKNLATATEFADNFFKSEEIRSLKLDMPSGYQNVCHTQNDRLILEDKYWEKHLPEDIALLSKSMHETALKVLRETLRVCNVAEEDWDLATGGAASKNGNTFLTFNHYSPEKPAEGLFAHRDFGQITILFINQKSLQVKVEGEYKDANPLAGHFIINYGRALETYINDPEVLTAVWHRVLQVIAERISFGIFVDSNFKLPIYKKEGENHVLVETTFGEYLQKIFAEVTTG